MDRPLESRTVCHRVDSSPDPILSPYKLLLFTHQVRHNAPDTSHGFGAVIDVEEIEPACSL